MANPAAKKTIINVKGVDVQQWERAKTCANRSDETLGEWLSRAVKHLADMEEGGREFPPGVPDRPRQAMTPEQVAALMQATAALQTAAGRPVPQNSAAGLRAVADDLVRAARGLPPKAVKRVANRPPLLGKAALIDASQDT
jgi:hypothetical protein